MIPGGKLDTYRQSRSSESPLFLACTQDAFHSRAPGVQRLLNTLREINM